MGRVCLVVIALSASATLRAQNSQASSLRGITNLTVVVDSLAPAALELGVTDQIVLGDAERLLRRGGVTLSGAAAGAQLSITINAVEIQTDTRATRGVAYTVSVSIDQEATLQRSGVTTRVTTWRHAGIGVAGVATANATIRSQLAEYLEVFLAAYRTANKAAG